MPWKRNDDGTLVIDDNNPVRLDGDGKEYPMPDKALDTTLSNLSKANGESAERKRKLRELEQKFEPLKDIEDFAGWQKSAQEALEIVSNLDDKKLIDSGEVEKVKKSISESYENKIKSITDSYETKLGDASKVLETKDKQLRQKIIFEEITKSEELKKTFYGNLPGDAVAVFGPHFDFDEDGKPFAHVDGVKILSDENPGEVANIDEAIRKIINKRPDKDSIYLAQPGGGGTPPGGAPLSSTAWRNLPPAERLNAARAGKIK